MSVPILNFEFHLYQPIETDSDEQIKLRTFTMNDARLIYQWRTHPIVRAQALDESSFSYEQHHQWCEKKINDLSTVFLMAEVKEQKIGTVRYDITDRAATVSIYVNPDLICKGFGRKILLKSMHWMNKYSEASTLLAQVKSTNIPSVKLFERCGFVASETRQKDFS